MQLCGTVCARTVVHYVEPRLALVRASLSIFSNTHQQIFVKYWLNTECICNNYQNEILKTPTICVWTEYKQVGNWKIWINLHSTSFSTMGRSLAGAFLPSADSRFRFLHRRSLCALDYSIHWNEIKTWRYA